MGMSMMGFGRLIMLMGLLVVVAVIAVIIWAVVHFAASGWSSDGARPALDEPDARAEIGEDDYQRMKRQLG